MKTYKNGKITFDEQDIAEAGARLASMHPTCFAGEHDKCKGWENDRTFEPVGECRCVCHRTCSECGDSWPFGWTEEDHFNCNYPEDEAIGRALDRTELHGTGVRAILKVSHEDEGDKP